ncbi:MAG: hypothetical protein RR427_07075 [Cellulosilyticaceae bacterium]
MEYIIAHDLGTSGNKASLYTIEGQLVKSITREYDTRFFNNNWAEQDVNFLKRLKRLKRLKNKK